MGYFSESSYTHRTRGAGTADATRWDPYGLAAINGAVADGNVRGIDGRVVRSSCGAPEADAACVSQDILTYYTTSPQNGGRPVNVTRWRDYDHRRRSWYKGGKALWDDIKAITSFASASARYELPTRRRHRRAHHGQSFWHCAVLAHRPICGHQHGEHYHQPNARAALGGQRGAGRLGRVRPAAHHDLLHPPRPPRQQQQVCAAARAGA
jgi:hypothetical protein